MGKSLIAKTDFSWGELGESLQGRIDIPEYQGGGLSELVNFDTSPQGSLKRRPGFKFLYDLQASNLFNSHRLISVIMPGGGYRLAFINDTLYIVGRGITTPIQLQFPRNGASLRNLQWVQFGNLLYFTDGVNTPRRLNRQSDTDWLLEDVVFRVPPTINSEKTTRIAELISGNPNTVGSEVVWRMDIGTSGGNFADMSVSDIGRILINRNGGQGLLTAYNSANNHATVTIQRSFTLVDPEDFLITCIGSPTVRLDLTTDSLATGANITLTARNLGGTADVPFFTGENQFISINGGTVDLTGANLGNTAVSSVTGRIVNNLETDDSTSIVTSSEPAFRSGNNPSSVTLFNGRLVYGGTTNNPQRVWFSRVSEFDNFSIGTATDDGIEIDLVSTNSSVVRWMAPSDKLIVGCTDTEIEISSTSTNVFGPATVEQRRSTTEGSTGQQPVLADNSIIYYSGKKVLRYGYDFQVDNSDGRDLTLVNEDIVGVQRAYSLSYSPKPQPKLYATVFGGGSRVLSFIQETGGWTKYETNGTIVDTAAQGERIYFLVLRNIGGQTRCYLESIDETSISQEQKTFVDTAIRETLQSIEDPDTDNSIIVPHLAGQENVDVLVDIQPTPRYLGRRPVDNNGKITNLDLTGVQPANIILVGIPYESSLKTLPLINDTQLAVGQWARSVKVWPQVWNSTTDITVNGNKIPSNTSGNNPKLFTGNVRYSSSGFDGRGLIQTISTDAPYPLNISGIFGTTEGQVR